MASTVLVAVRKAIVAGLTPLLDEQTTVSYGWPGSDESRRREIVFTSGGTATHDPAALKAGRNFRDERMEFDVVVLVIGVGQSPEDTDDRALEIGVVVEEFVADHKNSLGVPGLNWIRMARMELHNRFAPNGSLTEITYSLLYDARLTQEIPVAQFKYVGGADEVEIPGVGSVKRGGVIDVAGDLAVGLAGQEVWEPVSGRHPETVDLHAMTKTDLEHLADERGVDLTGLKTKADYIAALEAADTEES